MFIQPVLESENKTGGRTTYKHGQDWARTRACPPTGRIPSIFPSIITLGQWKLMENGYQKDDLLPHLPQLPPLATTFSLAVASL